MLTVEIANCRTERPDQLDVYIDSLSIVSRDYDLKALCIDEEPTVIGWQEKAAAHFKVVSKDSANVGIGPSCCLLTGAPSQRPKTDPVSLGYLCLHRAHESYQDAVRLHHMALARAAASQGDESGHPRSIAAIRRANTGTSSQNEVEERGHATSLARLCPTGGSPQSLHLFCSWRDKSGSVSGDYFVRDLVVRPLTINDGCPIALSAEYPNSISKDFKSGPASVPLTVNFRNILVQDKVAFEFSVVDPDAYDFTGPEKCKTELGPGEQLVIPFSVSLCRAGIYNLQRVRLTIDGATPHSYDFPEQWMVVAQATE
jgi:hypothetical protein